MKYLVLLVALLLPTCALADDGKPIRDALEKLETGPAVVTTNTRRWGAQAQCSASIGIHSPHADIQSDIVAEIEALPEDAKCTALGPVTTKGEGMLHYYTAIGRNASGRRFVEFWISSDNGRLLKTFEALPDRQITVRFDYDPDRIMSHFVSATGRAPSEAFPNEP